MLNKKWALFALVVLVGASLLTACEAVPQDFVVTQAVEETVQETVVEKDTVAGE